ncbi:hypothetical protein M758_11G159600 [Ceratodon purpureus]|nr:hypothetical protein M758_11G159600 [Ceratodon purpureus]
MKENYSLKKNVSAWRNAVNGYHGTMLASYTTKWSIPKGRHLQRAVHNLRVTILCGFVTVLVLRGTIGTGTFASLRGDPVDHSVRSLGQGQSSSEPRRVLSATTEQQDEKDPEPESSDVPYSLGAAISNWDSQRTLWIQRNPGMRTNSRGRDRILLVTGSQPKPCDNPVGDHLLLKSLKNKLDYCRLHDIDIFYNMAHLDHEMAGFWAKLPLLRKLMLAHPEVEWMWWMDSDAMFTDMVFELPMAKYRDVNMVLHGFDEMIYTQKSWVGLNTGSFLFRNCQWSLDLLDAWAPMGPKGTVREEAGKELTATLAGRPAFEADDQSALIYLLLTQKRRWAPKVFLENQYYLHGYWVILVERFEAMMAQHHPGSYGDDRWPFVTHFVGCKPCGSYGDYAVERCVAQMERAFNFGDNQVLELYGFQHRTLSTHKLRRLRNDTSDPLGLRLAAAQGPGSPPRPS